jgi:putative intracellular protease/amidase
MKNKTVYMYVFDTMADWEWGYVTAELKTGRFFKKDVLPFTVKTFSLTKETIVTIGGVRIIPDIYVEEIVSEDCALLLLPGGETWLDPMHAPVIEIVKNFLVGGIPVAAICGATIALAAAGILDQYLHTSNDLSFLKAVCPQYKGEKNYQSDSAVTDRNLISAGGVAPLELAYHILKKLAVCSDETLDSWYKLNKLQDSQYFYKLMQSLQSGI